MGIEDENYHGTSELNAGGIEDHGLSGDGDGRVYYSEDLTDADAYARGRARKDSSTPVIFTFGLKPGVKPQRLGDGLFVDESEIDRPSIKRLFGKKK